MELLEKSFNQFMIEIELRKRLAEADTVSGLIDHECNRLLTAYKKYVDDMTERELVTHKPRNATVLKREIYLGIINEDNWKVWASMYCDDVAKLIGWNYKLMHDAQHVNEGVHAVESYLATLMHGLELLEQNGGDDWLDIVEETRDYWI